VGWKFERDAHDKDGGLTVEPPNLAVAQLVGARLTRGAYLALSRAGLTTEDPIGLADDDKLERVLGGRSAVSVLRQAFAVA
jgi:hypothetical protein